MKRFLFLSLLLLSILSSLTVWATHNRAGEISYVSEPLPGDPYRYKFLITTYTKTGGESDAADRDSLDVDFGDGTDIQAAPRVNGSGTPPQGVPIPGTNIKLNIYEIYHSYAAPFDYLVSMQDPNRIAEIINFSNSVDVPFYIDATVRVRSPQFLGINSSPVLFQPPIDYGNVGSTFIHNPNAFDPDGDSLHFKLIPPRADRNTDVPFFALPDAFPAGPENDIFLDPATGEFTWETPQTPGIYNIAFLITEFRNGLEIGNVVRDMQIIVEDVDNEPPIVEALIDTCITVGDTLIIEAIASDPDIGQSVTISAFGGPLEVTDEPAEFPIQIARDTVRSVFTWATNCSHIYSEEYTVVIKAEDDFVKTTAPNRGPLPLADLETWQITIAPPPPKELRAEIVEGDISLSWNINEDYPCQDSEKFMGYAIWRSIGCDSLDLDICQLGLEGTSYVKIADGIMENTFVDDQASEGIVYSYRVVAEFADAFTGGGTPLNVSSSVASLNTCVELPKDSPIITNVSIESTALNNGSIYVAWSKPVAEALDTVLNPPPYRYELYRTDGIGGANFELVTGWDYTSFFEANDTNYVDQVNAINTQDLPYSYKIAFYSEGELIDETATASSVFLSVTEADNALNLSWDFSVPWLNLSYDIYRQNQQGTFDSISTVVDETTYRDTGLANGQSYCYYIKAVGTYSSNGLPDPLINLSQINCGTPIDTIPPCEPSLSVQNACDQGVDPTGSFNNELRWNNPNETCADDVIGYNVYYSTNDDDALTLIGNVDGAVNTTFSHALEGTLAGCYQVSAIDSFQNESILSNIVCKENCLTYELPNTFTPNGDNQNDLFVPRKASFVSSVDMKVFNRWGELVFETDDPLINWDGTDQQSGEPLAEGTYYYVCDVLEQTIDGFVVVGETLNGYIYIIR